jgi:hypothetical protein
LGASWNTNGPGRRLGKIAVEQHAGVGNAPHAHPAAVRDIPVHAAEESQGTGIGDIPGDMAEQ